MMPETGAGEKAMMRENPAMMKQFVRQHWAMVLVMAGICIAAVIGAIYVLLGVVENAQATGLVPMGIGEWTVGYFITFILHLIFWEIVLIGIPLAIIAFVLYMLWWKRISGEGKGKFRKKKSDKGGDFISFLTTLVWLYIVWSGGKWDLPLQNWTLNDWVYTWVTAFVAVLIFIGVIALIWFIWWVAKE